MDKIMFKDKYGLTDAVLRGRKTMTRRMVSVHEYWYGMWKFVPKYKIGEVVAVAQTYKDIMEKEYVNRRAEDEICSLVEESHPGCTNKLFVKAELMPHRIRITDIKVERLQDISEEDCLKEGIVKHTPSPTDLNKPVYTYRVNKEGLAYVWFSTPQKAFAALIDKVSGKGTWERNPYVFAYSFQLI